MASTFQSLVWVWLPALKGERLHRAIDGHDAAWCGARVDHSVPAREWVQGDPPDGACARCVKGEPK